MKKNDDGEVIRVVTPELKDKVLKNYYWPHHHRLAKAVNDQLNQSGKALILDCHSYPGKPLKRDLDQSPRRPDFNIGTDTFHTPVKLIEMSVAFFGDAGYSLGVDWPYRGSIVPLEHYQKSARVQTIMLEINRALYLKESTNEKSAKYSGIKRVTAAYIKMLENYLDEIN